MHFDRKGWGIRKNGKTHAIISDSVCNGLYSESQEKAQVAMFEPVAASLLSMNVFEQRWIIVNTWSGNLFSGWNGGDGERWIVVQCMCVWCTCAFSCECVLKLFKTLFIPQTPWDLIYLSSIKWSFSHAAFGLPSINLPSASKPSCIQDKIIKKRPNLLYSSFSQSTAKEADERSR